jgi:hypothetical protein
MVLRRDDDYAAAGKPTCHYGDPAARGELVDALTRDARALLAALDGPTAGPQAGSQDTSPRLRWLQGPHRHRPRRPDRHLPGRRHRAHPGRRRDRHAGEARFGVVCATCPLADRCTTARQGRTITSGAHEARLAAARQAQARPAWQAGYKATRPRWSARSAASYACATAGAARPSLAIRSARARGPRRTGRPSSM